MKSYAMGLWFTACLAVGLGTVTAVGQSTANTADAHVALAKAAAAQDHTGLFGTVCAPSAVQPATPPQQGQAATPAAPQQQGPPPRSQWHAEPVKVFDNLYFVGQTEYSAWAVTTSDGIIVIDTIFNYSVEDEVVEGLKKLGLDPAKIKYAIVSHGHGDHSGGAKYLQEHFGTRIILSASDWDLLERNTRDQSKPKRDMVATDGQKLTIGDTTLTLYLTPGHTPGTISTLIPVKDGGKQHLAAEWGGTAFNFPRTTENFMVYSKSAERFRDIVTKAGADVLIANHTLFDGSKTKLPALSTRKPGDPNPYVIGNDAVKRYLTVADECAKAALAGLNAQVSR